MTRTSTSKANGRPKGKPTTPAAAPPSREESPLTRDEVGMVCATRLLGFSPQEVVDCVVKAKTSPADRQRSPVDDRMKGFDWPEAECREVLTGELGDAVESLRRQWGRYRDAEAQMVASEAMTAKLDDNGGHLSDATYRESLAWELTFGLVADALWDAEKRVIRDVLGMFGERRRDPTEPLPPDWQPASFDIGGSVWAIGRDDEDLPTLTEIPLARHGHDEWPASRRKD